MKQHPVLNQDLLHAEMRVGGHETLNAVGTLLKGGERFLEIRSLLVTLLGNSEFQYLNVVQVLFMDGKSLISNMRCSSACDFFISRSSISLTFLFSKYLLNNLYLRYRYG
jgi:hypothetical protein